MTDFRTLKEWDKAHNFTVDIYQTTRAFPEAEILGLTQQLRLACSDIPIKLAQGFDEEENIIDRDYLEDARLSAIKAEYYLLLSYELDYLSMADYDRLVSSLVEVKGLIKQLMKKPYPNSEDI